MNSNGKQVMNHMDVDEIKTLLPGLYVHWPYCVSKCPYCDFNSHVRQVFNEDDYVKAICQELDHIIALSDFSDLQLSGVDAGKPKLGSIFFGGGTPSLMLPSTVGAILAHIRSRFSLAADTEITLEANPSSVEADRFSGLKDVGINRLSLGVQALEDEALCVLGRAHSVDEALGAVRLAQKSFGRMSFDLIYGRHGQSLADWREELKRGLDLSRGHLSLYQLTIEEGTQYKNLFERGELNLPSNDRAARFFHETRSICEKAGMSAYEISNYASAGEQSRHNLVYWRYGTYMGVGPGAHGRIVQKNKRLATSTIRSPKRWMAQIKERGHGLESLETLSQSEQADEMLLMGMRLVEGVDLACLQTLTRYRVNAEKLQQLIAAGLCHLSKDGDCLAATDQGIGVLNQIVEQLSTALEDGPDNTLA